MPGDIFADNRVLMAFLIKHSECYNNIFDLTKVGKDGESIVLIGHVPHINVLIKCAQNEEDRERLMEETHMTEVLYDWFPNC